MAAALIILLGFIITSVPAFAGEGAKPAPVGETPAAESKAGAPAEATAVAGTVDAPNSANACHVDDTQADFMAGTAVNLDLARSPGELLLAQAEELDQSYTITPTRRSGIGQDRWLGQSFRSPARVDLTRVGLMMAYSGTATPMPITIEVRSNSGGRPGEVLMSGSIPAFADTTPAFRYAVITNPIELDPATSYLIVAGVPGCNCTDMYSVVMGQPGGYDSGVAIASSDAGATWQPFVQNTDLAFETYMSGYASAGTFTSRLIDSNQPPGERTAWGSLNWPPDFTGGTEIKFQVAASNSPDGPFNFGGPNGTATTFFENSPALLAQFNGQRYLRYKAFLSTGDRRRSPELGEVSICFGAAREITCSAVNWTNRRGVTVSGATLTRASGVAFGGAISDRVISSGEGWVEAPYTNGMGDWGLSHGDADQQPSDIDFAFSVVTGPRSPSLVIRERGVQVAQVPGSGTDFGDILRISVADGLVRYFRGGALVYTSRTLAQYSLVLDTSLGSTRSGSPRHVEDARICKPSLFNFGPPKIGVNAPAAGASQVGQSQQFVTTCSDDDGWRDIHTIELKLGRSPAAEDLVLWLQFDQDRNMARLYDPETDSWSEGQPGSAQVLLSKYAELNLAGTRAQGRGPTAPEVDITWDVRFKPAAAGSYRQYVRIEDDGGANTLDDEVGTWSVTGPCGQSFADVQSADYFHDAVYFLNCRGVVSGYGDSFRPYANTTRGQMVKIIVLARGLELVESAGPRFHDVPASDPFYRYVETAAANSIVGGYDDGSFRPYTEVTRGQLSKIVVVAMGWPLAKPADPSFRDVPPEHPFYVFVETALEQGIVGGYEVEGGREFRPGNNATRGQIAKIVYLAVTEEAAP